MRFNKKITDVSTTRHLKRYRQILSILFKYGFENLLSKLNVDKHIETKLKPSLKKHLSILHAHPEPVRVRMAFEELGTTFIKMGQILSTRPDLLPPDYIEEFAAFQDEVPPIEPDIIKNIIKEEFNKPVKEIFDNFETNPIAAASIGQAHRATTKEGKAVVVKVQRPDIRELIEVDLEILFYIAHLMEKHIESWEIFQPTKIVEEFSETLLREIDYKTEISHIERFARQFEKENSIYVPAVYTNLSSSKILTMEYIDAIKASDIDRLRECDINVKLIAKNGFDLIMKQILVHGFFHADPHPGNVFILNDNRICYIDFGMMGRLNSYKRNQYADLIISLVQRDEKKSAMTLTSMSQTDQNYEIESLEKDLAEFMDLHCYKPLSQIKLGNILNSMMKIVRKHNLSLPTDVYLTVKALSTVENLGHQLDPDFNVIEQAEPFIKNIKLNRLSPQNVAKGVLESSTDFIYLLKDAPAEIRAIFKALRQGKTRIEFVHKDLESMLSAYDRISNRLSFAIVLASLVIGSGLVILSGIPPTYREIPIIGIVGFLIAAVMGFWLLVSIIRSGRM